MHSVHFFRERRRVEAVHLVGTHELYQTLADFIASRVRIDCDENLGLGLEFDDLCDGFDERAGLAGTRWAEDDVRRWKARPVDDVPYGS